MPANPTGVHLECEELPLLSLITTVHASKYRILTIPGEILFQSVLVEIFSHQL